MLMLFISRAQCLLWCRAACSGVYPDIAYFAVARTSLLVRIWLVTIMTLSRIQCTGMIFQVVHMNILYSNIPTTPDITSYMAHQAFKASAVMTNYDKLQ